MSLEAYVVGLAYFTVILGATGGAAHVMRRRLLGHLGGSAAALALALLWTAALMLVHLVPGALTVLSRGTVLAAALALVLVVHWRVPTRSTAPEPRNAPPSTRREVWLAGAALVPLAVYLGAFLLDRGGEPSLAIDVLTFELPFLAEWTGTGSMWTVGHYWYGWSFGTYPMNGNLVALAAVLPWFSDALLRVVYLPYLLMTGLAAYALARELGAARAHAASGAALALALPTAVLSTVDMAKPDVVMFSCFAAGVVFLVRHVRSGLTSDLLLGGLGLGIALGTKWYGLTCVAIIVAVWIVTRRRGLWLLSAMLLAAGGFWFLRNLVASGNPLFPQKLGAGGVVLFDAPPDPKREILGRSLAEYLGKDGVWRRLVDDMRNAFAAPGALAGGLIVAAVVRARRPVDARVLVLALVALLLLAAYAVTPYTAQPVDGQPRAFPAARYAVPMLVLGCALGAWAMGRLRHPWIVQLAVLAAILDGLTRIDELGLGGGELLFSRHAAVAAALISAVVAVARVKVPLPVAGTVGGALLIAGGYVHMDRYMDSRYRGFDPVVDRVVESYPAGHRIGIAGTTRPTDLAPIAIAPLYGPRLGNDVDVMGAVVEDRLNHPPDRRTFDAQVSRRDYDLLVLLRRPGEPRAHEEAWAGAMGFREIERGEISVLMERAR